MARKEVAYRPLGGAALAADPWSSQAALATCTSTWRPAAASILTKVSSPNSSILPRMRSDTRGWVTPNSLAAWLLAEALAGDVAFRRHHQRGAQPHVFGLRGRVIDRIPHAGEAFVAHHPSSFSKS